MTAMASQITSLTIVHATVYSGPDQRKHQSLASLAFVRRIHRWPVNSPHKWPVTRKMFPFYDVIMHIQGYSPILHHRVVPFYKFRSQNHNVNLVIFSRWKNTGSTCLVLVSTLLHPRTVACVLCPASTLPLCRMKLIGEGRATSPLWKIRFVVLL